MSPEEDVLLKLAGESFIYNTSQIVVRSTLHGLYFAIFALSIRILLKRNLWTRYTWILLGFLAVLFLISSANLAVVVAILIRLIRGVMINNAGKPLLERLQLADKSVEGLNNAQTWLDANGGCGFLFVFADAVVVWRAYVLWPGNKIAKAIPLALLLASFGFAIAASVLDTIFFLRIVPASSSTGITLLVNQSLSVATNVVATALIGYKAYQHRQMMKASIGVRSSVSAAILLFLTESGVAFCIIQIIAIGTELGPDNDRFSPRYYVGQTWSSMTAFAAAAYPVLVLIIVNSHRSISDHTRGSAADSGVAQGSNARSLGAGSHLSFAAPPPGLSSGGDGVGTESMIGSHVDPITSAGLHSNGEGSTRFRDLEKGEQLAVDALRIGTP